MMKDITLEKKEEQQERMIHQYDMVLRSIYNEFYEINVTKESYHVTYYKPNCFALPTEEGTLQDLTEILYSKLLHPEDRKKFKDFCKEVELCAKEKKDKQTSSVQVRKLWSDGKFRWAEIQVFPLSYAPEDEIYLFFTMDVQEKKDQDQIAEENRLSQLRKLDDERYRIIVEQTETMVFEWSPQSEMKRYYSDNLKKKFCGDYDGRDIFNIWLEDQVIFYKDADKLMSFRDHCIDAMSEKDKDNRTHAEVVLRLKCQESGFIWCRVAMTCIFDENNKPVRILGTVNDVDEAIRFEQALRYRAEFDVLTGIYNADTFYTTSGHIIEQNPYQKYAILRMDINRFKLVNDLYGREEGDRMLKFIANLLQVELKQGSTFGRISSDVFCACVPFQSESELVKLIGYLSDHISNYCLGYTVVPSFGICVVDDRTVPVSTLCDWANLALQTVKGNMIKTFAFYDDTLRAKQLDERMIEEEMQQALEKGQFCIFLQPKHDLRNCNVIGAEALVRWVHPEKGLIVPDRFIPLFERNGFIIRLDEYVWEQTCATLRSWIDKGYDPIPISMNVSRVHIYNPGFGDKLCELLEKYDLPAHLIELELTESTFIENPGELYLSMKKLQDRGFTFSMDDFGSGYSSLNMLKNAPVNTIKLDREFLNETVSTAKGQTVIECTIAMAERLNLHVIAEGVETEKQASFLLKAGCTAAQGYYFSKPMAVNSFESRVF